MGKRILVPGLILLLLAAGVSAWLVLNLPGQGKGGGASASESGTPILGVSGGTPESTAKTHRRDADATSVQPGSRVGSKADAAGSKDGKSSARPDGPNPMGPDTTDSADDPPDGPLEPNPRYDGPTGPMPVRSFPKRIIDTQRPPNQTLGNARPASRSIHEGRPSLLLSDVSEKLKQDRRGLYAQYYAFQSEPLAELSKPEAKTLAQRDANLVRIDNQVHFPNNEALADLPFSLANFAATWDGYLVIPEQGEYWLFLGADNAARVDLDGETVLLNDVQSRYIEVSTVLELAPGLHPLHIEFAQGMLANEDSWRCAASFMWVPKGQQKPVAVPQEMLMVPDWMWSDDAPIITKLSKYEGEIGDEITIHGQGLDNEVVRDEKTAHWSDFALGAPNVYFNGQIAKVVESSVREIRVRVPIGASSGKLVIVRMIEHEGAWPEDYNFGSGTNPRRPVPSNSFDFKVTTQFGLLAQWHDLRNEQGFTWQVLDAKTPEITRLESPFAFESKDSLDVPFREHQFACRWTGRLGVSGFRNETNKRRVIMFDCGGKLQISIGGQPPVTEFSVTKDGATDSYMVFYLPEGDERYLDVVIDYYRFDLSSGLDARFGFEEVIQEGERALSNTGPARPQYFFPPVTPPKPPRIASVIPMSIAGDEPATPPFGATPGLVSVREGQQFHLYVEFAGYETVPNEPLAILVDGTLLDIEVDRKTLTTPLAKNMQRYRATLPAGCGEGKLTAKLGLSTSEPFYIDVANKGLIAYLYDLPNPSGYSQFPNILPLTCHTIRKEREINFGTADSFNLPFVAETFAVEWYGAIIIEQDGWYTFTSRTDDGCRVWLNGIEIIDDDNLHAPQEKSSERIRLVAGTYPFRMQFFENNQHEECLLFVSAVDLQEKELLARQVVPKRMFTWEVHDMLPDKVATGKKADGSD